MHFHRGVKGGYAELRGVFLEHLRCREATEVAIAEGWLKSILVLVLLVQVSDLYPLFSRL